MVNDFSTHDIIEKEPMLDINVPLLIVNEGTHNPTTQEY